MSNPAMINPQMINPQMINPEMINPLQLAHQWWATLDHTDRQRVWNARYSYLAGDLVESMANAGVPVVSDGRWSCVSVGPTGFTIPVAVAQLLDRLSPPTDGARGFLQRD